MTVKLQAFTLLGVCAAILACVSVPPRRDPVAGLSVGGPPAYPEISLGLVFSENTKNAIAYGQQGAQWASFDPNRELEKDLDVYRRNFKSAVKFETLEDAERAGVDLVALVDNFAKVSASVHLEVGTVFFTPQRTKLAEVRGQADDTIGFSDPGEVIVAVADEARRNYEQALRTSGELAQFARSQRAPAPTEPKAFPALRVASKMIVLPLRPVGEVKGGLCQLLTSQLLTHLSAVPGLTTIGEADMAAMLGVERQKDLLGCGDASCMAEIGGALGADLILHGEVGALDTSYNLNLSVVRASTSTVATRASRVTQQSGAALGNELPAVVREITQALNAVK